MKPEPTREERSPTPEGGRLPIMRSSSKKMIRVPMLAAVLIVVLSLGACGGSGPGSVGQEAADFSVMTLEGDEFNLADKRGKVVALFFMAGW
jgi:hypothetical protein